MMIQFFGVLSIVVAILGIIVLLFDSMLLLVHRVMSSFGYQTSVVYRDNIKSMMYGDITMVAIGFAVNILCRNLI